ncbi:hypothetical protein [Mycobacteroides abscessus]|uniref:hypothetical protein n=1 Tax=Mycobacteroides abscessus TaxID=36809 RepID=UPI000929BE8F|nr:hypothetical protein [Mycobacteroides abscessus]SIE26937.1 putative lipoprotein [Mycobacteroides abscessus subsp. abscessus]SIE51190.1 putative lipoprotein [Mycobacteroides abscessus subsp. abscessus]SLL09686.1 putative lipoprotein [Mycobacteroides abscessus subsp. abscessus]
MNIKRFGAALAVAGALLLPLAACGSSTPAPTVITVTPTTPMHPALQKIQDDADRRWAESHPGQDVNAHRAAERAAASQPARQDDGLPWWAWLLIVPGGLAAALVLGFKVMEWNDDRTVARAEARVAELESRPRPVFDYDDYEDDDEDDELPEADIEFLHRVTDPTPSAPAPPVQPASGGLLSSLRQQGGGAQ